MQVGNARSACAMIIFGLSLLAFVAVAGSEATEKRPKLDAHHHEIMKEHGMGEMGGNPAMGARLFRKKDCIKCHSIKGVGGDVGPDLGMIRHNHTNVRMAAILWNHAPLMTKIMTERKIPRPLFKGPEMAHLIAYLHSLEVLGDSTNGKRVFERKQCVACHAVAGVGGKIGPDLAKTHPHPPTELLGQLWNHAATMEALMKAQGIPWPVFEEGEMADLLAYIGEVQRGKAH